MCVQYDSKRVGELSHRLVDRIMAECPQVVRNGDPEHMYPGILALTCTCIALH